MPIIGLLSRKRAQSRQFVPSHVVRGNHSDLSEPTHDSPYWIPSPGILKMSIFEMKHPSGYLWNETLRIFWKWNRKDIFEMKHSDPDFGPGFRKCASFSSPSSLLLSSLELSDTQRLWALNTSPPRNRCTFLWKCAPFARQRIQIKNNCFESGRVSKRVAAFRRVPEYGGRWERHTCRSHLYIYIYI